MPPAERFRLTRRAARSRVAALVVVVTLVLLYLILFFFLLSRGGGARWLLILLLGLVGGGVSLFALSLGPGSSTFIELSDEGINYDDKIRFRWDDVVYASEEEHVIRRRGQTFTFCLVRVLYIDRAAAEEREMRVVDAFEGYPHIRQLILDKVAQTKKR